MDTLTMQFRDLSIDPGQSEKERFLERGGPLSLTFDTEEKKAICEYHEESTFKFNIRKPFQLKPHQVRLLSWCISRENTAHHGIRGGILCAEMGLGKTLTAQSLIAVDLARQRRDRQVTLVLCEKSLMRTWSKDFEKFFGPSIKVLFFHKDLMKPQRLFDQSTADSLSLYDVIVTTYDVVLSAAKCANLVSTKGRKGRHREPRKPMGPTGEASRSGGIALFYMDWWRIIADESHKISIGTKLFEALQSLRSSRRLCLTGTPIRNNARDLLSQFRFLNLDVGVTEKMWNLEMYRHLRLDTCLFQMDYESAEIVLPPLNTNTVMIELKPNERRCYDLLVTLSSLAIDKFENRTIKYGDVLAMITRLRQVCISPHILTYSVTSKGDVNRPDRSLFGFVADDDLRADIEATESWIAFKNGEACFKFSKFEAIKHTLKKYIPKNEKIIVFSNFRTAITLFMEAMISDGSCTYQEMIEMNGQMKQNERDSVIDRFQTSPVARVLCMTYKVGAQGLNLPEANHVIFLEPWWSPTVEDQAVKRCHRLGQTRPVKVWKYLIKNSIEDRVRSIGQSKRNLAKKFMSKSNPISPTGQSHQKNTEENTNVNSIQFWKKMLTLNKP